MIRFVPSKLIMSQCDINCAESSRPELALAGMVNSEMPTREQFRPCEQLENGNSGQAGRDSGRRAGAQAKVFGHRRCMGHSPGGVGTEDNPMPAGAAPQNLRKILRHSAETIGHCRTELTFQQCRVLLSPFRRRRLFVRWLRPLRLRAACPARNPPPWKHDPYRQHAFAAVFLLQSAHSGF